MKKALSVDKGLLVGIVIFVLFIIVGLFAKWIAPHPPLAIQLDVRLQPPSVEYWFGTDHLGRCIFSRIIYGVQTTITTAIAITLITLLISLPIGLVSGYWRGRADQFFMRVVDGTLSLPDVVLTIAIVGILGPGFVNMVIAIVLVRWANYVRFIRSLAIKAGKEEFILSARMSGNSHLSILRKYIFPQIKKPVFVFIALDLGRVVLLMAGLSFLGLGVQPPTPEWGVMLHDATSYFQLAPHIMIFPGLAILLFVLCCQLTSERLKKET
ncbi:nickel transporter permease [Alkalihalobacterium bogoriense]|uniref:nickel transporter permease n=1 Tax=Alkalihalobacterium bogoriense TaxID=246272 RepID=UPI00047EF07C|nr:nickel transporter permease [Alkalihalobacterium bogoriense]